MCCLYALLSGCYLDCLIHRPRRQTLRAAYNLEENPGDFITTFCCGCCANIQEANEMKARGKFHLDAYREKREKVESFF